MIQTLGARAARGELPYPIVDQFGQQGVDKEAGKKEESVVAVATVDEDEASRAENKQHEALSDKDEDDEEDDGHGKRHRKPGDGGDEGPGKKKVGQVLFWLTSGCIMGVRQGDPLSPTLFITYQPNNHSH